MNKGYNKYIKYVINRTRGSAEPEGIQKEMLVKCNDVMNAV